MKVEDIKNQNAPQDEFNLDDIIQQGGESGGDDFYTDYSVAEDNEEDDGNTMELTPMEEANVKTNYATQPTRTLAQSEEIDWDNLYKQAAEVSGPVEAKQIEEQQKVAQEKVEKLNTQDNTQALTDKLGLKMEDPEDESEGLFSKIAKGTVKVGKAVVSGGAALSEQETYQFVAQKVYNGIVGSAEDLTGLVTDTAKAIYSEDGKDPNDVDKMSPDEVRSIFDEYKINLVNKDELTVPQRIMGELVSFMATYLVLRRAGGISKMWREGKTFKAVGKDLAIQGFVGFLLTDTEEGQNVMNLIEKYPWAKAAFLDSLAVDQDDSNIEKRLKQAAIEGGFGLAGDAAITTLGKAFRVLSKAYKWKMGKEGKAFKDVANSKGIKDDDSLIDTITKEGGEKQAAEGAEKGASDAAGTKPKEGDNTVDIKSKDRNQNVKAEESKPRFDFENKSVVKDIEKENVQYNIDKSKKLIEKAGGENQLTDTELKTYIEGHPSDFGEKQLKRVSEEAFLKQNVSISPTIKEQVKQKTAGQVDRLFEDINTKGKAIASEFGEDTNKLFVNVDEMIEEGIDVTNLDWGNIRRIKSNRTDIPIEDIIRSEGLRSTSKRYKAIDGDTNLADVVKRAENYILKASDTGPDAGIKAFTRDDVIAVSQIRVVLADRIKQLYDLSRQSKAIIKNNPLDRKEQIELVYLNYRAENLMQTYRLFSSSVWDLMTEQGTRVKLHDLDHMFNQMNFPYKNDLSLNEIDKILKGPKSADEIFDIMEETSKTSKKLSKGLEEVPAFAELGFWGKVSQVNQWVSNGLALKVVSPLGSAWNAFTGTVDILTVRLASSLIEDALGYGGAMIKYGKNGTLDLPLQSASYEYGKSMLSMIVRTATNPREFVRQINARALMKNVGGESHFLSDTMAANDAWSAMKGTDRANLFGKITKMVGSIGDWTVGGAKHVANDTFWTNVMLVPNIKRNAISYINRTFPNMKRVDKLKMVDDLVEQSQEALRDGSFSKARKIKRKVDREQYLNKTIYEIINPSVQDTNLDLLRSSNAEIIQLGRGQNLGQAFNMVKKGAHHIPVLGGLVSLFTKVSSSSLDWGVRKTPILNMANSSFRNQWKAYGNQWMIAEQLTGALMWAGGAMTYMRMNNNFIYNETDEQSRSLRQATGLWIGRGEPTIVTKDKDGNTMAYTMDAFNPISRVIIMGYKLSKASDDLKSNANFSKFMRKFTQTMVDHVNPALVWERIADVTEFIDNLSQGKPVVGKNLQRLLDTGFVKEVRDYKRGFTTVPENTRRKQLGNEYQTPESKTEWTNLNRLLDRTILENTGLMGFDVNNVPHQDPFGNKLSNNFMHSVRRPFSVLNLIGLAAFDGYRHQTTVPLDILEELADYNASTPEAAERQPYNFYPKSSISNRDIVNGFDALNRYTEQFEGEDMEDKIRQARKDLKENVLRPQSSISYQLPDKDYADIVRLSSGKNITTEITDSKTGKKMNITIDFKKEYDKFIERELDTDFDHTAISVYHTNKNDRDKIKVIHSHLSEFGPTKEGAVRQVLKHPYQKRIEELVEKKVREYENTRPLTTERVYEIIREVVKDRPANDDRRSSYVVNNPTDHVAINKLALKYLDNDDDKASAKEQIRQQLNSVVTSYNDFADMVYQSNVLWRRDFFRKFATGQLDKVHQTGVNQGVREVFN